MKLEVDVKRNMEKKAEQLHKQEERLHHKAERAMEADEKIHKKIARVHTLEKKSRHQHTKKVTLAKGVKAAKGVESKLRAKKGGSSTGKYKKVSPKKFAGKSGGTSPYSFPIPDLAHARNALARAHFAPDPEGIKAKVYKMYPQLKKRAMKRKK